MNKLLIFLVFLFVVGCSNSTMINMSVKSVESKTKNMSGVELLEKLNDLYSEGKWHTRVAVVKKINIIKFTSFENKIELRKFYSKLIKDEEELVVLYSINGMIKSKDSELMANVFSYVNSIKDGYLKNKYLTILNKNGILPIKISLYYEKEPFVVKTFVDGDSRYPKKLLLEKYMEYFTSSSKTLLSSKENTIGVVELVFYDFVLNSKNGKTTDRDCRDVGSYQRFYEGGKSVTRYVRREECGDSYEVNTLYDTLNYSVDILISKNDGRLVVKETFSIEASNSSRSRYSSPRISPFDAFRNSMNALDFRLSTLVLENYNKIKGAVPGN